MFTDKRNFIIIFVIFSIVVLGWFRWNNSFEQDDSPEYQINEETKIDISEVNNDEYKYIIGIEDNKVAIYSGKEKDNQIIQITEIKIKKLPESEKDSLKKGIKVESDKELFTILEGLVSYYQD